MLWRHIRTHHHQPGLRRACHDARQYLIYKPLQGDAVGTVPEASKEQHGERLAPAWLEFVARRVDARAQALAQPAAHLRQKRRQVFPVLPRAHLHLIAAAQQP